MQRFPARKLAIQIAGCASLIAAFAAVAQTVVPPAPPPQEPATIDAQSIEGISGLEVTARGGVEFRQGEFAVFAEYLKFNREFGRLEAEGGVRVAQGADRFFGPRLRYDTTTDTGTLDQPTFLMRRQQTARGFSMNTKVWSPSPLGG
jgi:lipopolysaccharide assembly outer membrane protein LptD (OstA)